MSRLSEHGGMMVDTDGRKTVELVDPNDNSRSRYQYRREGESIERRRLTESGEPYRDDGSPWTLMSESDLTAMRAIRGEYHPILDPLGL